MEWGFISGEFSRDIEIDKVVPGLQERRIKGRLFLIMCYWRILQYHIQYFKNSSSLPLWIWWFYEKKKKMQVASWKTNVISTKDKCELIWKVNYSAFRVVLI